MIIGLGRIISLSAFSGRPADQNGPPDTTHIDLGEEIPVIHHTPATMHRIEFLHLSAAGDLPILRHVREAGGRYLAVRPRCLDCLGEPVTIPPDDGFDAAVLLAHDPTCPLFLSAVRAFGGAA
jgi:hypothetical protein